ncbi:hypothetical protein JI435_024400 [Parastagonospora nodorum SN15]|uniref:Aminoglycoside phosphotransferase domain-containing protein n=1 Tax=Phaeosphaeria nodorum (strain SN15 / ATCC MYA-4574 / FGSC 10173) TaxID=321614 RepID=A0A7U2ESM7_PHANO|nr:hypothetical protein JI435_024400 [Parastagonospora nodorum SN15]
MSTSTFWSRFGIEEEDAARCVRAVRDVFVGWRVREFEEQGWCSFTLIVERDAETEGDYRFPEIQFDSGATSLIVQIRPPQHALEMSITRAAEVTFPSLAPTIQSLDIELPGGLHANAMNRMPGTPLSRLLPRDQNTGPVLQTKQERLVRSFAAIIAHSWGSSSTSIPHSQHTRADSPMDDKPSMLSLCKGKVGSTIISRLRKLGEELPDAPLRDLAQSTLAKVQRLDDYLVVLNHGDLIPSNILVDEDTWVITGLVDWAEAEYLPFGTCLYGLENLLGCSGTAGGYVYYENEAQLRDMFWKCLFEAVPELKTGEHDVRTMRDLGVLLWYGIAWDDGAIDRVVNETEDEGEVACLRAFLSSV